MHNFIIKSLSFNRYCLNVSQVQIQANDDAWGCVEDSIADTYTDKPIVKKKNSKKEVSSKRILHLFYVKVFYVLIYLKYLPLNAT